MNEENKAVIKALNMFGRVPKQWELLNEIERLNNIINELEYWLRKNLPIREKQDLQLVLNKLEQLKKKKIYASCDCKFLYYKELKGSDKE